MRATNLTRRARRFVADTLYRAGVLAAWQRLTLRRRAVVLMYHRVLDDAEYRRTASSPAIVVRRSTFERQLRVLQRHFRVLSADELRACIAAGRPLPPRSCVITFDDGWIDTYRHAWPLLREFRMPAIVFVPVSFIDTGAMFWQERLHHLLDRTIARSESDPAFGSAARRVLADIACEEALALHGPEAGTAIASLVERCKARPSADVCSAVERLEVLLGDSAAVHPPEDAFMTWGMAKQMAGDSVTFGSHSVTHRLMTTLTDEELADEARRSKETIERQLGYPVFAFCYPNGDWNPAAAEQVRRAGYDVSFSTQPGTVGIGDDRFALRRINIQEDMTSSDGMFMARLLGLV